MKLKDALTLEEREELQNIMRREPVHDRQIFSRYATAALWRKGLILRVGTAWFADWEAIKSWPR